MKARHINAAVISFLALIAILRLASNSQPADPSAAGKSPAADEQATSTTPSSAPTDGMDSEAARLLPWPTVRPTRGPTKFAIELKEAGFRIDGKIVDDPDHAIREACRNSNSIAISFDAEAPMAVAAKAIARLHDRGVVNVNFSVARSSGN